MHVATRDPSETPWGARRLGKLSLTLTLVHLVSLGCSAWGWSPPWHFVSFLGPSLLSVYLLLTLLFFLVTVSLRISDKSL